MRLKKATFFLFLSLLTGAIMCHGQVRKSVKSATFRQPTVSRSKAKIVCPIFETSQYPYQGIGFKMGDPLALTYKFYPNKNWAFAADGGKAASGLYNKYYRNAFETYLPDSLSDVQSISYLSHKANSDWFLEAKFLYQWDAGKISKGLQFYAGLGWQWRSTRLTYDYLYEDTGPSQESNLRKFTRDRFTYGPVGVLGFEYSYFSLPISAFIEIEWFTDVLLDPGYQRFQGGVGLRYVF
ncbi:MAG: hypothetical protein KIT62_04240 [Cyclobacteriaceae bacterium]|nr:hypothetical protein [Cyclobacteriaceae bacterium]